MRSVRLQPGLSRLQFGQVMRFGSRNGQPFGASKPGIEFADAQMHP